MVGQVSFFSLCKVLLGFYQVVGTLDTVYAVQLPAEYLVWYDYLAWSDFNVPSLFLPGTCLGNLPVRLAFNALWPFCFVVAFLIVDSIRRWTRLLITSGARSAQRGWRAESTQAVMQALPVLLVLIFCLINSVSRMMLQAFGDCATYIVDDSTTPPTQISFLRLDLRVECSSTEHDSIMVVANV